MIKSVIQFSLVATAAVILASCAVTDESDSAAAPHISGPGNVAPTAHVSGGGSYAPKSHVSGGGSYAPKSHVSGGGSYASNEDFNHQREFPHAHVS